MRLKRMKIKPPVHTHRIPEVREEIVRMIAEVFKLVYLRYGNTGSMHVIIEYLKALQPDELSGMLIEAEHLMAKEIEAVEDKLPRFISGLNVLDMVMQKLDVVDRNQVH